MFNDLRGYISKVEELGECRHVEGAEPKKEIGAISHLASDIPDSPLLVFDKIKGYAPGYRVASNLFTTARRTALAMGFPLQASGTELVRLFRDKVNAGMSLLAPVEVETGPVKENILTGDEVDLYKFPAPVWHELDGGPYIGTGTMTVVRDPEEGWVNVACYRVQVHDKTTATIHATPAHHLGLIQEKYWAKGEGCPAVVTCGQDPVSWLAANWAAPWGVCEYDIAGWWRGKPLEVTKGVSTDLPIPATAEIALEGEIVPPQVETRLEGPFGEWTGYYATGAVARPAFRVKSILHRHKPIIQGNPPSRNPAVWTLGWTLQLAATIWSELDRQLPGVKGVWVVDQCNSDSMLVISIKQCYAGHAKQAALVAVGTQIACRYTRYVIVVDDDIDPSNMSDVLWAVGTRADPETAIHILEGQVSTFLDPLISPEKRRLGDSTSSVAVILAVRPYHWIDQFPSAIRLSPESANEVKQKWAALFASF